MDSGLVRTVLIVRLDSVVPILRIISRRGETVGQTDETVDRIGETVGERDGNVLDAPERVVNAALSNDS